MKRVASIQDISCLGRCSLTVALPVISAMEVECAILPTAVLSAHTMFPDILCRDLTADILPIARYWQSQQVRLDAVYTGYLASPRQAEDVCQALEVLAGPDTLRFVDPAMADGGALYTGFDEDFPRHMARLAAQADVVTPNLTEACLLTGTPYREDYDLPRLRDILRKLAELGPRHVVLTGVPYGPDKLGVLAYTPAEDRFFEYGSRRIDAHFPGTGDLFSSACVGALMRGKPLEEALRLAVDFTLLCIQVTCRDESAPWYGVEFEKALRYLPELLER